MKKIVQLPGLYDIHVHLREPNETYKEDFYSGTCAALAGGVTTVFDMPSKLSHVLSKDELVDKLEQAKQKAVCDYGLYYGTDGNNTDSFASVQDQVVGLKIYLHQTTGHVLFDDVKLEKVFKAWPKRKVIVFHVEDDKINAVLTLSKQYSQKIHITHVNTKILLKKIIEAKRENPLVTCDVTPHHLFLTEEFVNKNHGYGMVRPPLVSEEDRLFLWDNLDAVDCIATDHAPHTKAEKESDNPPTGLPGLETTLPLLLTAYNEGRISIEQIIRLTNTNPQKIFNIVQDSQTIVEVDVSKSFKIDNKYLKTKCGWSPFHGFTVRGSVETVFIRGMKVYHEGEILVQKGFGKRVRA